MPPPRIFTLSFVPFLICCRNVNAVALAVLHPRKLSVFLVRGVGGGSGAPSYLELSKQYEHKLDRSAFNMCHGGFGGMQGRAVIACGDSFGATDIG